MRYLLLSLAFFLLLYSCKKDEFDTTSDVSLSFSADTVMFDTVFTSVGSATEVFTVHNTHNKPVIVSSIRIAGGDNSNFRLNVNGMPGKTFYDVEIGAKDSIFIFAEVTIDPNNPQNPWIVTDSIVFITNGNMQHVNMVAWGQDAYFHSAPPNTPPFFLLPCNETWTNDKPHVVYGYAMVDSACTLTINEGTNVHFHPGSGMIVLNSGTLHVNGTPQNKVTFQGDRLQYDYVDVPGQWDRIWFSNINVHSPSLISPGSRNSHIRNAVIKNGTIGLLVDTVYGPGEVTLELENTIVKNMSANAIAFRGSTVNAYNCVFANAGTQIGLLLYGGDFSFYHCTFANFWSHSNRQDPVLVMNNYVGLTPRPFDAYFGNSIIYGNNDQELALDTLPLPNQAFNFQFDHALLKVENSFPTSNTARYMNIIKAVGGGNNPRFADVDNNNYQIDSTSIAVDAGNSALIPLHPELSVDLNNESRPKGPAPDLGAYERR